VGGSANTHHAHEQGEQNNNISSFHIM